jgi:hypothetical protein
MGSVDIVTYTQYLLVNRPRYMTYKVITDHTMLHQRWLEQFAIGRIKEPSAQRIQMLYEYLTGKPLVDDVSKYTSRTKKLGTVG